DLVEIDQREVAHAAARERLCRPGADTADTDHDDVRLLQALEGRRTEQPRGGGEAPVRLVGHDGNRMVCPVVFLPSRSRCAWAASAIGWRWSMRIFTLPVLTCLNRSAAISSRFFRLATCGMSDGRVR